MSAERSGGRAPDALRPTAIEPGFVRTATGSALISCGETRVICTASAQESVPRWLMGKGRGWVTAEYGMLPASTGDRKQRDVSKGRPDGRTVEIQRLIGRALRGVVDFEVLGENTIWLDCDVLEADAGTRCASITGAYVALELAVQRLIADGVIYRVLENLLILDGERLSYRTLDVEQIDLMPVLDCSLQTYYDCFHLTPAGSRAVAAAVAAAILRQPLHSVQAA